MLTDPLSVTFDGSTKSLPRTSVTTNRSVYGTADGELEISISKISNRSGVQMRNIKFSRRLPDPTPLDVFDAYREIRNSFSISYEFDSTRANISDDLPKLRTALLAFVDSALLSRLIAGEM